MTNRDDARDTPGAETPDDCAAFEAALPDYLERSLAGEAADAAARHVAHCARCRTLVGDLEEIRSRAAALPAMRPPRDLWADIEARIADRGPVGGRVENASSGARQAAMRRWFGAHYASRVAALAAGLVIATASLTYLATRALVAHTPAVPSASSAGGDRPGSTARLASEAQTSEYLYNDEIASLRQILDQRRTQLDPKTVVVIEHNLAVIDTAIAQSKAALAKDPANAFLADQLDRDLDTKLELLRTVALLPSRT